MFFQYFQQKGIEIWARPILPVYRGKYSYSIVFLNRRTDGTPSEVSVTLRELGLDNTDGYHISDLYDNYDYGIVTPERRFKVDVNPSGSKFFLIRILNYLCFFKCTDPRSITKSSGVIAICFKIWSSECQFCNSFTTQTKDEIDILKI